MNDPLDQWLAAFPATDAQKRLRTLQKRAVAIEAEIEKLSRMLATFGIPIDAPKATPASNGDRPHGMDAVEAMMRERGGVWTRRDLNTALVERGWLAEGESGRKTLGSILYRMVRRNRILRVGEGRYRLPANDQQEVLAA